MTRELKPPLHPEAFSTLLPLLRHGALAAEGAPALDCGLVHRLVGAFTDARKKRFVLHARKLADDPDLSIRRNGVYLRTENTLTARFIPPHAREVGPALTNALKSIDAVLLSNRGNPGKTAICLVLGSQILATIHPFNDGNGRTARMFFAAKILRHLGPAPTTLLGILLMSRAGAHQYHQASWALRAGDAEPMVALFVGSERLAHAFLYQSATANMSQTELLEHCWTKLRVALPCGFTP